MTCVHVIAPLPDVDPQANAARLTHYLPCAVCEPLLADLVADR